VWGAIAGGFLGGVVAVRRMGLPVLLCADAVAPPIIVAQAIGRWGNYFNQELYGRATSLPWAVRIDPEHRIDANSATYHPTFLYESLWNLGVAAVCIWADRRFRLGKGRVFALYVSLYCLGRAWIEAMRIDEAHRFLGLRLNDYVSLALFIAGLVYLWVRRGQREPETAQAHGLTPAAADTVNPDEAPVIARDSDEEPDEDPDHERDEAHATGPTRGKSRSSGKD
jgi:prolipoprotein diacylglyceryl transferase